MIVVQESISFHLQFVQLLLFLLQVPHQPLSANQKVSKPNIHYVDQHMRLRFK